MSVLPSERTEESRMRALEMGEMIVERNRREAARLRKLRRAEALRALAEELRALGIRLDPLPAHPDGPG
jgi:hypothetical protein